MGASCRCEKAAQSLITSQTPAATATNWKILLRDGLATTDSAIAPSETAIAPTAAEYATTMYAARWMTSAAISATAPMMFRPVGARFQHVISQHVSSPYSAQRVPTPNLLNNTGATQANATNPSATNAFDPVSECSRRPRPYMPSSADSRTYRPIVTSLPPSRL